MTVRDKVISEKNTAIIKIVNEIGIIGYIEELVDTKDPHSIVHDDKFVSDFLNPNKKFNIIKKENGGFDYEVLDD